MLGEMIRQMKEVVECKHERDLSKNCSIYDHAGTPGRRYYAYSGVSEEDAQSGAPVNNTTSPYGHC
jgi:hypothetical protein